MQKATILGIETSCDDTSAAVVSDGVIKSNVIASQLIHNEYGGVVPELASRAHQINIVPVVDAAIKKAGITKNDISAIAFTQGPGLLGSLLVGTSFTKGLSMSLNVPMIGVNHLHGHILAHFVKESENDDNQPKFPFLCLLVSGGHSQLVIVRDYQSMEIVGQTIDDAAGEAFDKCAKVMDLGYPGGPQIDKFAKLGNAHAFNFNKPRIKELDYSFSGLKTSFLYFLRDQLKLDSEFIQKNKADLCASIQRTIIEILIDKLDKAVKKFNIKTIAVSGGVSANSGLQSTLIKFSQKNNLKVFIPKLSFTTDNAAMIAIAGYYKYLNKQFVSQDVVPLARMPF